MQSPVLSPPRGIIPRLRAAAEPALRLVWRVFLDLLFPAFCLECGKEGRFVCHDCLSGISLTELEDCVMPDEMLDRLVALGSYRKNHLLPKLIHSLKYDFVTDLAEPLGWLMIEAFLRSNFGDVILVPVPLHPKRQRWRGFNQAELLAKRVASATGFPVLPLLVRTHFRRPQMELSKIERQQNIENAFAINPKFASSVHRLFESDKEFLLIDDVATTLSTLHSCAKTLRMGGARSISALVLARVHL